LTCTASNQINRIARRANLSPCFCLFELHAQINVFEFYDLHFHLTNITALWS
jgi:hypothetical protein